MPAVALGRLQHAAFSFSFGAKVKPEMAMWIFTLCSMKGFSLWPNFPCQVFSPDTVFSIKYFLHLSISFTDVEPLPLSAWKTIHFFISSQIFIFSKKRSQLSLVQRSFSSHYFPCHRLYELFLELRWCEDQLMARRCSEYPHKESIQKTLIYAVICTVSATSWGDVKQCSYGTSSPKTRNCPCRAVCYRDQHYGCSSEAVLWFTALIASNGPVIFP